MILEKVERERRRTKMKDDGGQLLRSNEKQNVKAKDCKFARAIWSVIATVISGGNEAMLHYMDDIVLQ